MDNLLPGLLAAEEDGGDGGGTLPVPPVDKQACALLGPTALVVQGLMAIIVLSSLLIKRYRENPRREWSVWLGDVSKQIIGQGFLHSSNVLISTLFQTHHLKNACTAYFLSIFVDCTIGVVIIYANLRLFSWILIDRMRLPGFKSGQYHLYYESSSTSDGGSVPHQTGHRRSGNRTSLESRASHESGYRQQEQEDEQQQQQRHAATGQAQDDSYYDPSTHHHHDEEDPKTLGSQARRRSAFQMTWWLRQLAVYIIVLAIMKSIILAFFWIPLIFDFGDWLLSWMKEDVKIVFVLMIFPLLMNAFQFLIIDTILKSSAPKTGTLDSNDDAHGASRDGNNQRRRDRGRGQEEDDEEEEHQAFLSLDPDVYDQDANDERTGPLLPTYEQSAARRHPSSLDAPAPTSDGLAQTKTPIDQPQVSNKVVFDVTETSWSEQGEASPSYPPTLQPPTSRSKILGTHKKHISDSRSPEGNKRRSDPDVETPSDEKATSSLYVSMHEKQAVVRMNLHIHEEPPMTTTRTTRRGGASPTAKVLDDQQARSAYMLRTGSAQTDNSDQSGAGWDWLDEDEQEAQRAGLS